MTILNVLDLSYWMHGQMGAKLPRISINIAVYNEGKNIDRCLSSVFKQRYPTGLLEVLVIDGGSTDKTLEIASKYPVKILPNRKRDSASGRMLGLKRATGDLHVYLDADMELPRDDWVEKMIFPLLDDKKIVGSFTRFMPKKTDPPLNRCLSYNKFQHDPMFQFFSPKLEQYIVETREQYKVCEFCPPSIPVVGVIMFRMSILRELMMGKAEDWMWSDVDFPIMSSNQGYNKFAYVEGAGLYHRSYLNLGILLKKKRRDVTWSYLPTVDNRNATYVNYGDAREVLKIVFWIIYANLFLPELVRGLVQSIRHKDWACLYIPLVALIVTDYVAYLFLRNKKGRQLLIRGLKTLLLRR